MSSTAAVKAPPITVEQYEGFRGYPGLRDELIFGEIVMSPHAKPLHQEIARTIDNVLRRLLKDSIYTTVRESNVKFPYLNSMPSPDVYVVTRAAVRDAIERDVYIAEPPVLTVEVLSPANRRKHIAQKIDIYLGSGVLTVWTVDPKNKTIVVNTADHERVFQVGDVIDMPEPLPRRGLTSMLDGVAVEEFFRLDV